MEAGRGPKDSVRPGLLAKFKDYSSVVRRRQSLSVFVRRRPSSSAVVRRPFVGVTPSIVAKRSARSDATCCNGGAQQGHPGIW